jgi:hypothetical protein
MSRRGGPNFFHPFFMGDLYPTHLVKISSHNGYVNFVIVTKPLNSVLIYEFTNAFFSIQILNRIMQF